MTMRDFAKPLLLLTAWSLSACERAPKGATPAVPTEAIASASQDEADATESSLELKRGRLSLSEEQVLFQPCGAQDQWWVIDQTPSTLTQTFIEESQAGNTEFYIEAYGERAPATGEASAHGAKFILVLEEILYAGVPGEGRGCDAPSPSYVVAARGTEPFWLVEVYEQRMVWRQPEDPKELVFGVPDTLNAEGGVRYTAVEGAHQLELIVHAQACRDGMSGEYFAYTAKASLDGREVTGCARLGE